MWTYACIKRYTYFFVAFAIGKWTQETCRIMMRKMYERVQLPFPDNKIEIFTDGDKDYEHVLSELYAETCMTYGQLIKIREKGRVVDKEKRLIFGNPDPNDIETTDIENFNGICRERGGRVVRKTKCFSKYKRRLECAIHLFQFYWNFINEFKRDTSPAISEELSDHIWSWHEFLMYHFAV